MHKLLKKSKVDISPIKLTPRRKEIFELAMPGGRKSEIFRLTWSDVDLQKEKIRLTDNKSGNGTGALTPNAPGTGQGAQVVAGCPPLQGGQCVHAASE